MAVVGCVSVHIRSIKWSNFPPFLKTSLQRRRPEVWPEPSSSRPVRWGSDGSASRDTWAAGTTRWSEPWSDSRSCRAPWTSWTCGSPRQRRPKVPGSPWETCWSTLCRTTSTGPWWVRESTCWHCVHWCKSTTVIATGVEDPTPLHVTALQHTV